MSHDQNTATPSQPPDRAAVRALLLERFTWEELRRFCRYHASFQFIDHHFGPKFSFIEMVDVVVEQCERHALLDKLQAEAEAYSAERLGVPFLVPFLPNPDFVGREQDLERMHEALLSGQPVGLSGMGGVGKTQLAVEYAHRHRDAYPGGVLWVNAASVDDWSQELVNLADRLGLKPADKDSKDRTGQMIAALSRHLGEATRALVIFDNVAEPRDLQTMRMGPGIAASELGCVLLFTTRRRDLPRGFRLQEVGFLQRPEARQIVLAVRPAAATDPALDELCRTLGNLPLALNLAAAALRNRPRLSLVAYLENLRKLGADQLHEKARVSEEDLPTYYATSLTPALEAQWATLEDDNARLLLRVAAELGEAEYIPVARLGLLSALQDDEEGLEERLSDAVHELAINSLVELIGDQRLRLHPLVREFAMALRTEEEAMALGVQCAENLAAAYEEFEVLEHHCARRGVYALEEDLGSALRLLAPTYSSPPRLAEPVSPPALRSTVPDLTQRLGALRKLVRREAHTLRDWDPAREPHIFAQQIYNRALEVAHKALAAQARARLVEAGRPYLELLLHIPRESQALLHTFTGHSAAVVRLAVTPDGAHVLSASASAGHDESLRLWNLFTGQELRMLPGSWAPLGFTADGRQAILAGERSISFWDLGSNDFVRTLESGGQWAWAAATTSDGRRAVCVADDGKLLVVDLERGAVVRRLVGPLGEAEYVAVTLTPDDRYAITGHRVPLDEDTWNEAEDAFQALRMWDLDTGQELPGFFWQEDYVGDIAVTPDGRLVLAVVAHFKLVVWDMETRQHLRTLGDGAASVPAFKVTHDSRYVVAGWGSQPSDVKVWDLQTGQEVATEHGHSFPIGDLALSPDGQYLLSGGGDFVVKVWDLAQTMAGQKVSLDRDQGPGAWLKAMLPGRRSICFATRQGALKVWDFEKDEEVLSLGGHEGIVRAVAVTSDERYAVSMGDDGRLKVWDLGPGERLHSIPVADAWQRILALTLDDQQALSLAGPATVGVWDLGTGQAVGRLKASSSIFALAVTPNGRRAVTSFCDEASESWGLEGWDLETGRILFTVFDAHWDSIDELIPTPDSRHVLSVCRDGSIGLWEAETGEPIHWLDGHEQWARTVAVTQDSRCGISCANDGTLRVWDLQTGQEERVLRGHGDWVWDVVLSGDERRAFSISNDQTIRVWDWQRGDMLAKVTLGGFLEGVMLDQDRNVLAVQERSGTVYCLRYVEPEVVGAQ